MAEITKLLFGESRRHIIPVGKSFTVEDVQAQQPDTEDFLDVKNLAPGMFATPPKDDPPKPAAGDGAPEASAPVSITVQDARGLVEVKAQSSTRACLGIRRSCRSQLKRIPAAVACELSCGVCSCQVILDGRPSSGVSIYHGDKL